jgi:hypothetical protein
MKKTFPFFQRGGWLPAGCLLALGVLTGMKANNPETTPRPAKKDYQVAATVPTVQLRKAFAKTRQKELSIYLYVVKGSPNRNSRDVRVIWYAVDSGRKPVFGEKGWSNELLAKQSGWYVHFLRLNGVAQQNVVMGYHVRVDPKILAHISGLKVNIYPFQMEKNKLNLTGDPHMLPDSRSVWLDSCKIPPGCDVFPPYTLPTITRIVDKEYSAH